MSKNLRLDDKAPWKERFRAPVILSAELARATPKRGLVASNRTGAAQLYAWDVPTGDLAQLTNRREGVMFGVISPDGRYAYYLDDKQGNEIGHYVRVPFEGGGPQDVTPELPPYASWNLHISLASNLLGFTLADADGFSLCCIDQSPEGALGKPRTVYRSKKMAIGPALSHDGEVAVMASVATAGKPQYDLLAFDTSNGNPMAELRDGPGSSEELSVTGGFSPIAGDFRFLTTTRSTGVERPIIWNPRTDEREDLVLDGVEGEIIPLDWSLDGDRLLLCQFNRAVQNLHIYNLTSGTITRLRHPHGSFGLFARYGIGFGPEGEVVALWQDSTHPPQVIALDAHTGIQTRTLLKGGRVPASHPWKSVSFASSDGREIQGWLGLPGGEGPFPTILHTHGGPWIVMTELFRPMIQAWLDHGFAVLTINYRGSATFGLEFQEQIGGNPGHWEVEDMAAAHTWLVEKGIARPDRIFLNGWSYGGYLTLQALGKRPDLWAGGMAGVAVADLSMMHEDSADTIRGFLVALLGGTPEERPAEYAAGSPISYVENVRAPVLIIQGRHDTRCPARQVEAYEAEMKSLGKAITVHWFDAGHTGSAGQVEEAIQHQELMLRFAQGLSAGR